mmetsp:Transcript_43901/g.102612  ORF Transcript_43901/g.102612 Transcript_43901/m.102612 type:complete len:211 (-) Transcript_43901:1094-1726(-)
MLRSSTLRRCWGVHPRSPIVLGYFAVRPALGDFLLCRSLSNVQVLLACIWLILPKIAAKILEGEVPVLLHLFGELAVWIRHQVPEILQQQLQGKPCAAFIAGPADGLKLLEHENMQFSGRGQQARCAELQILDGAIATHIQCFHQLLSSIFREPEHLHRDIHLRLLQNPVVVGIQLAEGLREAVDDGGSGCNLQEEGLCAQARAGPSTQC